MNSRGVSSSAVSFSAATRRRTSSDNGVSMAMLTLIPPPWARRRMCLRRSGAFCISASASPPSVTSSSRHLSFWATTRGHGGHALDIHFVQHLHPLEDAVQLAGHGLEPCLPARPAGPAWRCVARCPCRRTLRRPDLLEKRRTLLAIRGRTGKQRELASREKGRNSWR